MRFYLRRSDAGFVVTIDDREPISVESDGALVQLLGVADGRSFRIYDVALAGYSFRLIYLSTAQGPVVRHTLGSTSAWLPLSQAASSLESSASKIGLTLDLNDGVSVSVEDRTDHWRWSLNNASTMIEKWQAVLSDDDMLAGLPPANIIDILSRRLTEVGVPSNQPEALQQIAEGISGGESYVAKAARTTG